MPREVFKFTKKNCKKSSKVGLLATEGTLKTGVYDKIFNKDYKLVKPSQKLQKKSVNKAIKLVKMGNVKAAANTIKPAINELIKNLLRFLMVATSSSVRIRLNWLFVSVMSLTFFILILSVLKSFPNI